jgi:hypothetical protein
MVDYAIYIMVLSQTRMATAAGIYCKLFRFYLSLGQHATHFDGGMNERMNE